ncbi:LLM class F420-dependent oxidoreductase [Actinoplanes sichuanensis]|uniref:TIGR03619 family F420-dependent LLM class oxidoreductase n=1 Tax=Actinoplanes sichuanensis TaxID=512349 RepID=A0ABW4A0T9_9ACTN|nr:TIGR03619 family F420-dependent LLM class oxidoreductase [Actinoplanes sichuanensis]BEL04266.1 LLM class F420-dependent oxidoreductase [Actinoplanes sichuanensis]
MPAPKLLMVLTENWTLVPPRDLRALIRLAVEAEQAGIDGVMLSEHIVLGPGAGAYGVMANPRDYAAPGNQDPAMPWPSSTVLMAAIAQATSTLRIVAGAIIAPLRHPLHLAKELATLDLLSEGRLVVLPSVSWHRDEYDALGVPFHRRGRIMDEQLEILRAAWTPGPISHHGAHFQFDDVWIEPQPWRPGGPPLWFGGQGVHPPLLRRLVRYGAGLNPFGPLTDTDLTAVRTAFTEAGRDPGDLELIGGIRATFGGEDDTGDIDAALADLPRQLDQGFTTICFKPSMFIDDPAMIGPFCRRLRRKVDALTPR